MKIVRKEKILLDMVMRSEIIKYFIISFRSGHHGQKLQCMLFIIRSDPLQGMLKDRLNLCDWIEHRHPEKEMIW